MMKSSVMERGWKWHVSPYEWKSGICPRLHLNQVRVDRVDRNEEKQEIEV